MSRATSFFAAACLSLAAATAFAQGAPSGGGAAPGAAPGGPPHGRMKPCSEQPDPAKCEARRKELREAFKSAREACKDSSDRRACMAQQLCAKAPDPAKCQERAQQRRARREGAQKQ